MMPERRAFYESAAEIYSGHTYAGSEICAQSVLDNSLPGSQETESGIGVKMYPEKRGIARNDLRKAD